MNQLKRNTKRQRSVQVGRGGKRGKTSGRGHKGQHQHGGHGIRPEMRDFIKRLPKLRGRGKHGNTSIQTKPEVVNVSVLNEAFENGATINPTILFEKRLVIRQAGAMPKVKILGTGDLKKKLNIEGCEVSASAKEKIEKAGGSIKISEKASEKVSEK